MDGLDAPTGRPDSPRSPDPRLGAIRQRLLPEPPYVLERMGTLMTPQPGNPSEAEGVLNPASARGRDGETYLFPRLVATGNRSQIGIARVRRDAQGRATGVERIGVALAPERTWERNRVTAGVEDPRITFVPSLGVHVMTYTAYSDIGPRIAIAVSQDLAHWQRLGPVTYRYDERVGTDLNFIHNKDALFFPEPVPGPGGVQCFALIHRPGWDYVNSGVELPLPSGLDDPRPAMWISYVPVDRVLRGDGDIDLAALTHLTEHRQLAVSEQEWEALKIGGGTPPIRVPEGWLILYHGVSGVLEPGVDQQRHVRYCAGMMILDADDPSRVLYRTRRPLLSPDRPEESAGIVPGVVFPTAIETLPDGSIEVYFGQADSQIGMARLRRKAPRASRRA